MTKSLPRIVGSVTGTTVEVYRLVVVLAVWAASPVGQGVAPRLLPGPASLVRVADEERGRGGLLPRLNLRLEGEDLRVVLGEVDVLVRTSPLPGEALRWRTTS